MILKPRIVKTQQSKVNGKVVIGHAYECPRCKSIWLTKQEYKEHVCKLNLLS